MKITLIKPNIGRLEHSLYVDEGRMQPLQLGVLAGLTPPDVEVVIYDDRMETIPYDEATDLAAITVETFTARRAYEIAAEYRKRGVPVIMGGFHPTLCPEEVAQHADSVYIGDAESRWLEVIRDAEKNRLKPVYKAEPGAPQCGTLPRRDLFKGKGYLPIDLIQFCRGCCFGCTYCAISVFFKQQSFRRSVREVVREIETQELKTLFFVDDNIVADHEAAKELFRALIPLKIRWVSQGSIDMTKDPELMDLMVRSGCLGNVIGFESIDPGNLRNMKKAPNLFHGQTAYAEPIRILRDHGLQTWAAFTLGHEQDTRDTIRRTVDFALENKFCFAAFNILVPYPRTPLYQEMEQAGRLLYGGKWWTHPEYRFNYAAFQPKQMSAEELTEECFRARRRFNSLSSVFQRFFDPKTNMSTLERAAIYWAYNPLFRKETFKKQGMRFGLFNHR